MQIDVRHDFHIAADMRMSMLELALPRPTRGGPSHRGGVSLRNRTEQHPRGMRTLPARVFINSYYNQACLRCHSGVQYSFVLRAFTDQRIIRHLAWLTGSDANIDVC